jgi:hypothetical protein
MYTRKIDKKNRTKIYFNDILMLVNVFLSLKTTLPKTLQLKTLDFLQQTITMNENTQWQMIKDSVLFALSSEFSVSKKKKEDIIRSRGER